MYNHLFVYGTLLNGTNEFAIYLKQHCKFYADGKFNGSLFDTGEYPGAILSADKKSFVHGSIFYMDNPDEILKVLDDYEGFGPQCPQPNEFIREIVELTSIYGSIKCWTYIFNQPVKNLRQIVSGRYLQ